MTEIIQFAEHIGAAAVDFFWLPVMIWTVLALFIAIFLNYKEHISAIYQYHFRAAALAALPAGVLIAGLIRPLAGAAESAVVAPLFVIQNPIAVATTAPKIDSGVHLEPAFWVGAVTILIALIAVVALIKLVYNFFQLRLFVNEIAAENHSVQQIDNSVTVLFSDRVEIPYTCGWVDKKVVLPADLKEDTEKCKMALHHELIHIKNHDYFINSFLQTTKALFCFHPLVHRLIKKTDEFREIHCDINVLTDPGISQKRYAELLFELAPKKLFKNTAAVNMAVNPSTLKKRIQMMTKQTKGLPSAKRSMAATIVLALALIGFMACSDITDNGLTVNEVEKVQQKARKSATSIFNIDTSPFLLVLNGDVLNREFIEKKDEINIFSRIKTKYIKSITVLKGETAVEEYGEAGKNGVIKIQVYNKEKALNDLKAPPPPRPTDGVVKRIPDMHDQPPSPPKPTYIAVKQMPELKISRSELQSKVNYPQKCSEAGIEGTVYVQFVVQPSGNLTNFEVIKGIGGGCDEAAVEAIKKYAKFTPGVQSGKKVPVRMSFPIVFRMNKQ